MRAKTLHPRKSTSRCSHREQRRRPPCKRRHTRALAVRRVDSSRADAQGLTRVRRGGPTGAYPSATAQCRVWAPADARSLSTAGGAGGGGGGPGRARAGERRASVRGTPRHRGGPAAPGAAEGWRPGCVRAPGPAGGTWTRGRASDRTSRVRRPLGSRCRCAQTRARPPGCDQRGSREERGGPGATSGRQPAPCAALRGDRPEGGEHGAMGETDMAALHRERGRDPVVWSLRAVPTSRRPESCIIIHISANRP